MHAHVADKKTTLQRAVLTGRAMCAVHARARMLGGKIVTN